MLAAAAEGFITATDLADWLVRALGMPFRQAHHVTGTIVKLAEDRGCGLDALPLADMQAVHPEITAQVFDVLSLERSVASRTSFGGTAPRSEEHTSELQSLMRISYAVFCLKTKTPTSKQHPK